MTHGRSWTRRHWLASNTAALVTGHALANAAQAQALPPVPRARFAQEPDAESLLPLDATTWESLAQRAVDAARDAGAQYADARLSRTLTHIYRLYSGYNNALSFDQTVVGVGVRALVNGYWGFAAQTDVDAEVVTRLAQDAVAQARTNAKGPPRTVELGHVPVARGRWSTPVRLDPFAVTIEEKGDMLASWVRLSDRANASLDTLQSWIRMTRDERVLATTDGTLVTQTVFETGGSLLFEGLPLSIDGLHMAGSGWEHFLDANIPEQLRHAHERVAEITKLHGNPRPMLVGRKTLVCDGATMASVLEQTLAPATQLDRALGYEANAGGTSFIDDPLAMVGSFAVAAPNVTVTGNRSAPTQLATVHWDDEGVVPKPFTIVKDGVVTDFQTNREQSGWLAPYYQRRGTPGGSHGCAGSESALLSPLQHMPNLALEPVPSAAMNDLIASVADGVYVTGGKAATDAQARTGMLIGQFQEIKNGRLGRLLTGGAVLFNTLDFWKKLTAMGDASTQGMIAFSQYPRQVDMMSPLTQCAKGQPVQATSHTVTAAAAVIPNQAIIDPTRRA